MTCSRLRGRRPRRPAKDLARSSRNWRGVVCGLPITARTKADSPFLASGPMRTSSPAAARGICWTGKRCENCLAGHECSARAGVLNSESKDFPTVEESVETLAFSPTLPYCRSRLPPNPINLISSQDTRIATRHSPVVRLKRGVRDAQSARSDSENTSQELENPQPGPEVMNKEFDNAFASTR